jgi:hypothetical protein
MYCLIQTSDNLITALKCHQINYHPSEHLIRIELDDVFPSHRENTELLITIFEHAISNYTISNIIKAFFYYANTSFFQYLTSSYEGAIETSTLKRKFYYFLDRQDDNVEIVSLFVEHYNVDSDRIIDSLLKFTARSFHHPINIKILRYLVSKIDRTKYFNILRNCINNNIYEYIQFFIMELKTDLDCNDKLSLLESINDPKTFDIILSGINTGIIKLPQSVLVQLFIKNCITRKTFFIEKMIESGLIDKELLVTGLSCIEDMEIKLTLTDKYL